MKCFLQNLELLFCSSTFGFKPTQCNSVLKDSAPAKPGFQISSQLISMHHPKPGVGTGNNYPLLEELIFHNYIQNLIKTLFFAPGRGGGGGSQDVSEPGTQIKYITPLMLRSGE